MCGIVGAIAQRNVTPILIEGLRRLEYRGYDSAGIAVINDSGLNRVRKPGKVSELETALSAMPINGAIGIAHTRWATHGEPSESNAHPHVCNGRVAIVHNGIIENYVTLKQSQLEAGFQFTSATDTEVIAHQIVYYLQQGNDLAKSVIQTVRDLEGAYAIAVIDQEEPDRLVAARKGSPLVIGIGIGEHFLASDVQALLPVTQRFIYLENGDVADLHRESLAFYNLKEKVINRPVKKVALSAGATERGTFRHFMLKEIYE